MARSAWAALLLACVLLLVAGCGGSSGRDCSRIVLRAVPAKGEQISSAGMQTAQQIVESRVNTLGVTSPKVTVHGDEIVIQYAGVHRAPKLGRAALASLVGATGRLQIFDFEPSLEPPTVNEDRQPTPLPSLYRLLKAVQGRAGKGWAQSYYLFKATPSHPVLQGPAGSVKELLLPYAHGKQPPRTVVLKVPANTEPVRCSLAARNGCQGSGLNGFSRSGTYWYLLKVPPQLTGKDIVESSVTADVDANTGAPIVTLQFTKHGSDEFQRITRAEYNRGRVNAGLAGALNDRNPNETIVSKYAGHNAFVLDGELEETPYIDYTDSTLADGIVGNAQITEPTAEAANHTALILQSGSLPYTFEQVRLSGCAR